jgi:hypothetical protein
VANVKDIDKGFNALFKRLDGKARTLTVGIHEAEAGAPSGDGKLTVGEVATINEYGLGVPERSFLRSWADTGAADHKATLRRIGENVIKGKGTPEQGLEQAGLKFVGEIQAKIAGGVPPPNAPSTVARKGSSTPLIDTGQLRSSIRHKVD